MMSVFTYKMCWLFHGYLRVSYMIKLTDYISPCFMLKSPITGGYLAKKQHTCTEQSYPNVQWRIPNNSSWIPSGTKKNVEKMSENPKIRTLMFRTKPPWLAPFGARSPLPLFHGEIQRKSNGDFIIPIILNGDFIITKSIIYPVSWMITIINHY